MSTSTVRIDPNVWRLARLKFVAPLRNERVSAGSDHPSYLGLENIEPWTGKIIEIASKLDGETADESAGLANIFREGDVLFSKLRPYLAKACYALHDGVCSTELLVMRPSELLEPRFLLYSILTPDFVDTVAASTFGAKMPRANWDFIGSLEINVPPVEEQRLIANYLDRETTCIDGLITEKERMLALLAEKRAALISRIVTRGLDPNVPLKPSGQEWLGEIPAHWNICQLKRTWISSDYGLSESIRDEGEIAVLRMSCIVDGRIDVSKSGMITEVDDHLLLRRNDLLFNRTNSLDQIAKVGLVDFDPDKPLTFASYLVRIRTNHRAMPQYLVALLNSSLFLEFARKNAIPAIGQANLSPTRYGEIHIPLPPKVEQEEIVVFLEREANTSNPIREHIKSSIDLLKERRAALITAAVTGQIPLEEMIS
ncbi:restriction endonuclease subunit S [Gluconobacter kanchanaburiensis]|uniref:Type I restriction endonuclease n=1 Tax=Gluconobacter kanchanaburiensis NBRC 103587 TaxID=1307948 RepID=A0A511B8R3_9PROT|nr:restriction endonuclease subunit S [Gluconobacter kanchanaburiensis]MBF0860665.1 restriction endonuclease subunit S [Gluconobacter kanchanaburiensis]GBR69571.1 restriction modification system DNA specificity subunit [Gluconobacter kanchanaburiensis NBRC 103587]GEK96072.1 type I restriction endonuclease [Gluconobacter kanchanaburiensis NBRC 103587]